MFGKADTQSFVEESVKSEKNQIEAGKNKIGVAESECGKIVIQVNLSKQSLQNNEITQIIRGIFENSNYDVEVEKFVLPTGGNTWQVKKMEGSGEKETDDLPASVFMNLTDKKRKKFMKHNRLYKIKVPKSLSRSRQGSKRKLSDKLSQDFGLDQFDVSEVHSSPAITNLLSQLYPNPYNLISLLEVQNKANQRVCKGTVDASDSCKITFKARNALSKESDVEQEFAVFSVPSVPKMKICDRKFKNIVEGGMGENESRGKDRSVKGEPIIESQLFRFTGVNPNQTVAEEVVNIESRKVKTLPITSGMTLTETKGSNPSREAHSENENFQEEPTEATDKNKSDLTMSLGSDNRKRSKMTTTESKITRKKMQKVVNSMAEKVEEDKIKRNFHKVLPPTGEKISISTIHPMSLQRTSLSVEEKKGNEKLNQQETENKPTTDKDSKAVQKPMTAKKKCVIQYLKLIKDMYEAEERCLQSKIDDAWNFALDQMEKPEKKPMKGPTARNNQQTVQLTTKGQEGKLKHSQCQTPKPRKMTVGKKKSISEIGQKIEESTKEAQKTMECNPELTLPNVEFTPRRNVKIPSQNSLLLRSAYRPAAEPSCSLLENHPKSSQFEVFSNTCNNFGLCTKKPNSIRTDTFVFRRKIPKNESNSREGLPIEIINRNVLETNRKIDLLIRHIDNSMDWLSQSEKTEPSNIGSLIEKAKDLSEKLEENLGTQKPDLMPLSERIKESWRHQENNNLLCNRSDLLLSPSYQSLHFFPGDRAIGSVRIRTDALFNSDLSSGNRDCLWLQPDKIRPSSLTNLVLSHSRSVNYLLSGGTTTMKNILIPTGKCFQRRTVQSEVSDLRRKNESMLILVEDVNQSDQHGRNLSEGMKNWIDLAGTNDRANKNICSVDSEKSSPSSLSISVVALDESMSAMKPVIIQEITWSFPVPAPSPVTRMHYRNERHMVFTTMEANVLHVARTTSFMDLALMSVAQVVEQEPKQQSSVIISLHKCSGFVKNNDGLDESGNVCKFVVLPSDMNFEERSSRNIGLWDDDVPGMDVKVLKRAESGSGRARKERKQSNWDPFQSESSMEMYDGDKLAVSKIDVLRSNNLDRFGKNLTWLHLLPDPYESNPADEDTDSPGVKQRNFGEIRSGPQQALSRSGEQELFPNLNDWDRRKTKFDGSAPPIFRYLSSETSNTSLDEKVRNVTVDVRKKGDNTRKISKFSNTNIPLVPDTKKSDDTTALIEHKESLAGENPENENDSSSTTSFKSSNDFSDVSELPELSYPKKRPKSRSHFLDKLFHELRSFRKCLTKRRVPKRKSAQEEPNEFEDALSELNMEIQQENKVIVTKEKQPVDEAVAVNSTCIDEIGSHAMPRKIFKTSFRGKESVTELMIDLKDVSISEVSDISVEKRKLSTDHTKISIIISKQSGENGAICCTSDGFRKGEGRVSREGSYHSLKDAERMNCLDWKKDANKSDNDADDDDYKSADSGSPSRSLENIPGKKLEEDVDFRAKMLIRDTLMEPRRMTRTFGRHKFDFYKKMENTTSFDSLKLDGNELLFSKYDKEIAPLKKALADMQFRVQNIQNNTFCTSDEYYERALRMAKMSAGYCRSCKSKAIIPEDPLGIYQKLVPRTSLRSPYSKQRKYYFKTTSSTNSSFYSIHSSNSDVSDKFCHLNSSASIVTNGLSRSRGPVLRESTNSNIPFFLGRTVHF